MLYKEIFEKRPTANKIRLHNSLSNTYLLDFAPYNEFAKAKVALRKQLEKEYKHLLKKNLSFRQYIDHITYYINTKGKKLYAKYLDEDVFIENSKAIEKDILSGVRGVTADNIDFKSFQSRRIVVPPIELQNLYAVFVHTVEDEKRTMIQSLAKLNTTSSALIQEYFK